MPEFNLRPTRMGYRRPHRWVPQDASDLDPIPSDGCLGWEALPLTRVAD
jgi:hypothetical protein